MTPVSGGVPTGNPAGVPTGPPVGVPKVHPITRAVEPEDPLNLYGYEVTGDPQLMLRVVVEEYARMGMGLETLMDLFRNPFYQGLYGLWLQYGDAEIRRRVAGILAACGVLRTSTVEATPPPEALVTLDMSIPRREK